MRYTVTWKEGNCTDNVRSFLTFPCFRFFFFYFFPIITVKIELVFCARKTLKKIEVELLNIIKVSGV